MKHDERERGEMRTLRLLITNDRSLPREQPDAPLLYLKRSHIERARHRVEWLADVRLGCESN